ncbi:hypothetical protein AKG34_08535 [Peribacillus butanolivorans]|uniref:hypothetical protein n=1 Tax=Peribacillus butanolivorans TaxID=421767 RepID=UPI0006A70FB9|nr:hypothetical protein [Peribacillus butanolivorans]KON68834.1 hypothetical protein AKG34_08535 [Peribacillus butanolivorans]
MREIRLVTEYLKNQVFKLRRKAIPSLILVFLYGIPFSVVFIYNVSADLFFNGVKSEKRDSV